MKNLMIILLLVQVYLVTESSAQNTCGNPADIVMILDASRSIWGPDFKKQIEFVRQLAKSVGVGAEKTHLSALTFGHKVEPQFQFNSFTTGPEILEAVSNIPFMRGLSTYTDKALEYVRKNTFTVENGARFDVPHIAILLTDGKSTFKSKTAKQAKLLKEEGTQVFAIGIGKGVSRKELVGIASPPEKEFVHIVKKFDDLKKIKQLLAFQACEVTTSTSAPTTTTTTTTEATTTTTTTTTQKPTTTGIPEELTKACFGKPAEIVFVLDKSSSIGSTDFKKQLKFVSDVSGIFDVGPEASRIGVVSFSDAENIKIEMTLGEYSDVDKIKDVVDQIFFSGGGTETAEALERTTHEMLSTRKGARSNAALVAIVITDGQSRYPVETKRAAKKAQQRGIHLFAIGVGGDVDLTELKDIASNPNDEYMFTVKNYDALASIKNKLAMKTCKVEPRMSQDIEVCGSGKYEADIVFALDTGKVAAKDVEKELDMVKNLSSSFDIDSGKIQVGMISACPGVSNVTLNEYKSSKEFVEALEKSSSVKVSSLMKSVRQEGFHPLHGGRKTAKKYCVIFVNGQLGDYKEARKEAFKASRDGIDIFTVAVGPNMNMVHLDNISAKPASEHVFHIDNVDQLNSIREKIRARICQDL